MKLPPYAELHCLSNYSFLRGASFPEELVERAAQLRYRALAITDECSLSGVVRAHVAAKEHKLHLIIGSEFQLADNTRFVLLATNRNGYGHLSHLITLARRNADKGEYHLTRELVQKHHPQDCLALWLPGLNQYPKEPINHESLLWLNSCFPQTTWIAVELLLNGDDQQQLKALSALGKKHNVPLCACGDVHMHIRGRRALQDTLTAIRFTTPINQLGYRLFPNGEHHLRTRQRVQKIYPRALLDESIRIAERCQFSLDELRYEYPKELVADGHTPQSWLRVLTRQGMQQRWPTESYPEGPPDKVKQAIAHELELIDEMQYAPYFLTVYDIVRYARSQNILCQGRGSAANSAVCYCLGITEVDPGRMQLLFERFISKERNEPPDIDVDFEHERREEVIQYIYKKYGRGRAALAATVITYRSRSAVRDVGKALGMSIDQVDRLAKSIYWWHKQDGIQQQLEENGFSFDSPLIKRLVVLVQQILGFPRHLSQHVGGFIISEGDLSHLVPIENATMADRTVIQWEKDDLESLGLLKIDILALGMLSAIRKGLTYISRYLPKPMSMSDVPAEDPAVYRMIQQADTIGVFQIESRAQMSMLPRLKPRNYYDLVIEIAIIRPGPIQGDMVHPYLRRRNGEEQITYPSEAVKDVLSRTLGVPIFQEQVMQLAMVAAGFTAGEADKLRRSMAAWKRKGDIYQFEDKLLTGMQARGYSEQFAQQIFNQIKGFGQYGFPESHSASFALLAYVSSWLKCYHPAAFTCALLNSQPMGFYAPAQLINDARKHGVTIFPVDVNISQHDSILEPENKEKHSLRLGLRVINGLSSSGIERMIEARQQKIFENAQDLASRAQLNQKDLQSLAAADALKSLSGDRHRSFWQVAGIEKDMPLFESPQFNEAEAMLGKPSEAQDIVADYATTGFTLGRHPLALLRPRLAKRYIRKAEDLWQLSNDTRATVAGLVISRQRPGSAGNVVFVTLEDESGQSNIVIWASLAERQAKELLNARLLVVHGKVQQEEGVLHLIADRLEDFTPWLGNLETQSRDFC